MPTENHSQTPFDRIRRALDAGETVDLETLSVRIIADAAAFDRNYPEHALLLRKVEPGLKPKRANHTLTDTAAVPANLFVPVAAAISGRRK